MNLPRFLIICCHVTTLQPKNYSILVKWRKKLLRFKNTQATARSESAVFFAVYPQELSNARSQKSLPQEAAKITASLKKAQEVVYKCSPGRSLWCLSPFYFNIICSVEIIKPIIYSLATKVNHGRTHVKSCLREQTAFSPFSAQ